MLYYILYKYIYIIILYTSYKYTIQHIYIQIMRMIYVIYDEYEELIC